jgi:hypothetical protein
MHAARPNSASDQTQGWVAYHDRPLPTAQERREALGPLGHTPRAVLGDRVNLVYRPPAWVQGGVTREDAMFLVDVIDAVRPRRVLEVGTCAGVSTAMMLHALRWCGIPDEHPDGAPAIISYDLEPVLYFDPGRPIGAAIGALVQDHERGIALRRGTARDAAHRERTRPDLVFIDADHRHPFPAMDLAELLPLIRPGTWVVLHDINMPVLAEWFMGTCGGPRKRWEQLGPKHLFDCWAGKKSAASAGWGNIGALLVPDDPEVIRRSLDAALARPFEARPAPEALARTRLLAGLDPAPVRAAG